MPFEEFCTVALWHTPAPNSARQQMMLAPRKKEMVLNNVAMATALCVSLSYAADISGVNTGNRNCTLRDNLYGKSSPKGRRYKGCWRRISHKCRRNSAPQVRRPVLYRLCF